MAVPRIDVVVNLASRPTPRTAVPNIPAPIYPSDGVLITHLPALLPRLPRLPRPATLPAAATKLLPSLLPTLSTLPPLLSTLRALTLLATLPLALSLLPTSDPAAQPVARLLPRLALLPPCPCCPP